VEAEKAKTAAAAGKASEAAAAKAKAAKLAQKAEQEAAQAAADKKAAAVQAEKAKEAEKAKTAAVAAGKAAKAAAAKAAAAAAKAAKLAQKAQQEAAQAAADKKAAAAEAEKAAAADAEEAKTGAGGGGKAAKALSPEQRREGCLAHDHGEYTTVKGEVIDVSNGYKLPGADIIWTQYGTNKAIKTKTDADGHYMVKLPRCEFFTFSVFKEGFATDTGVGACADPLLVQQPVEYWSSGVSPNLPDSEMRVLMTWRQLFRKNDEHKVDYTKDLDLHLAVPGGVQVLLPKYRHLSLQQARKTAKKLVKGTATLKSLNQTVTFKATDFGLQPDASEVLESGPTKSAMNEFDGHHQIYWNNAGNRNNYPYIQYELDHGSSWGLDHGGGPEVIHLYKILRKQYLIYVDCWTCDEYENEFWDDAPRKLTFESLRQFQASEAMVRVVQGKEQKYCRSISSTQGHPHTRWDAAVISCNDNDKCDVHDVNQFNKDSPTALYPPVIPPEAKAEVIIAGTPATRAGDTKPGVPDNADAQSDESDLPDAVQVGYGGPKFRV
jgi:hypothetical protein